jgi:two-component system cell cycle response regulator CpdR
MATLLLVDDDESTRLMCGRFFRRQARVEVVEAANGEEALDHLRSARFDCVLSDYRMGALTGIDVLAAAVELQPQARRVLMSGFADPALEAAARRRARIDAFIEKPLSMPDFERALLREVLPLLMPP